MSGYVLNFSGMAGYLHFFLSGLFLTAKIALCVTLAGIAIGMLGAVIRNGGRNILYWIWTGYVEIIRNTPFVIQLFFIFFGLPQLGLVFSAEGASVTALIVNLGAYTTEILRASIAVTPPGQWEACRALGLTRFQAYVHVILPPAVRRVWPAIVGQCVLVMLGSAVISQISCEDLTYAANYTQSLSFLAFEAYFVATLLYLALAVLMRRCMLGAGRLVFKGGC